MKNFIGTYDNALKKEECEYIINFINTGILTPGIVSNQKVMVEVKDSWDIPLDMNDKGNEVNNILFNSLVKYIEEYKKEHPQVDSINPWRYDPIYNLQKYNPGQGYHKLHCENISLHTSNRVMAWMFYLNTVTDGGNTYFENYDLTMNAIEGRLLIWPAYWTHFHKGVVSHTETKYIATGWFNFTE